jgi:predicted PurR-regulated permease PerM
VVPPPSPQSSTLLAIGRRAWTVLGIAAVVVLAWWLAGRLAIVVVPLLLALFPAALLLPAVDGLARHRVPRPLAVALVLVAGTSAVGAVVALIVPAFLAQLPALGESLGTAGTRLDLLLDRLPGVRAGATPGELVRRGLLAVVGGVNAAVLAALNLLAGLVLVVVLLACYLTGGRRIVTTATGLLPARSGAGARELLRRVWDTLAAYTRALFVVALFDATAVGLGLWLLDVPLVLPLAVLVFLGAFVPYVGAFVTGLLAVLVALADAGLTSALLVLALVVVVQQVEGNVLQPLVMGKVTRVSAFTVIVAVTAGATLLGVLGAFLAVPAAACAARVVAFVREGGFAGTP